MVEKLKILLVDDHPLILEGYKSKLRDAYKEKEVLLFIDTANDCDEAFSKISRQEPDENYDIVVLDINLPPSKDKKLFSGEDLGLAIRKISPASKLIVLTMYSDTIRLINILKNLNPLSFLIKSDVTPDEFLRAIKHSLQGKVYYSQSITNILRKQFTSDIILDENDRSILHHLSEGIRTKDLVNKVPLSLPSIEKRKKALKEIFCVDKEGDLALLNQAKKMGFL